MLSKPVTERGDETLMSARRLFIKTTKKSEVEKMPEYKMNMINLLEGRRDANQPVECHPSFTVSRFLK